MGNDPSKKIISFELPVALYEKIKAAAEADDRTVSSYMRKVLAASIEHARDLNSF